MNKQLFENRFISWMQKKEMKACVFRAYKPKCPNFDVRRTRRCDKLANKILCSIRQDLRGCVFVCVFRWVFEIVWNQIRSFLPRKSGETEINLKCKSQVPTHIPFKEKFVHGFAYQNRLSREVDEWPFHIRMATLADCSWQSFPQGNKKCH